MSRTERNERLVGKNEERKRKLIIIQTSTEAYKEKGKVDQKVKKGTLLFMKQWNYKFQI